MHLFSYAWSLPVKWQWRRSHHSIWHSWKPQATCKLYGSVFYRTGVTANRSVTLQKWILDSFCSCDLDLDPMTFICEPDLGRLTRCAKMNVKAFKKHHLTDRQTDRNKWNYTPRCFAGRQKFNYAQMIPVVQNSFGIYSKSALFHLR